MKKKLWLVFMLCTAGLTLAFGQEKYTVYFSSRIAEKASTGFVIIERDKSGKITIVPTGSMPNLFKLDYALCPLIPESFVVLLGNGETSVIDGNTMTTIFSSGRWDKTIVSGNTTTLTSSYGWLSKKVVSGNTTTITFADGSWEKTVVSGNTITTTHSDGRWTKAVINDNTTTLTSSDGWWSKTVVSGNTTTITFADGTWEKQVIDKQGYDVFVIIEKSS